jgi:hypothetical protein
VNDVQQVGSQIHALVGQRKLKEAVNQSPTEYMDYVLDPANGKLVERKNLGFDLKAATGAALQAVEVTEDKRIAPSDYAILQVDEITQKQVSANVAAELKYLREKLFSYSYSTGEMKELHSLFEPGDEPYSVSHFLQGNVLTSLRRKGGSILEWTRTDLASGKQSNAIKVDAKQLGAINIGSSFAADGRIYALLNPGQFQASGQANKDNDPTMAAVLDASSGKVLYRGKVVSADPKQDATEELKHLRLLNLTRHE